MISLATSSTNTRVAPEASEAKPIAGAKGSFSAVLAQAEPEAVDEKGENPVVEPADSAEIASTIAAALPGIALPVAAESGKELPVVLPDVAEGTDPETETQVADGEAEEAALALAAVPQLPLPAPAEIGEAEAASPAPATRPATPQPPLAAPVAARPDTGEQIPASERANNASRETAVALHVAQPAGAQTTDDAAAGGEPEGDALASRRELAPERVALRFTQTETVRQLEQATPAAVQPSTTIAAPAVQAASPAQRIDTLQELTRIVDRLAAAREVFAPAAEALAIEHAEFGELSLRFDQRRDGGLSVQLSASNPEAQRAVAQAVGAQSFQSAADDRAGAGPQNQPNTSRGAGADRDSASGNGTANRHEQNTPQQQRRAAQQHEPRPDRARAGIFA